LDGLENRYARKRIEGSNPSLSAIFKTPAGHMIDDRAQRRQDAAALKEQA
jgi:hypothetical protein